MNLALGRRLLAGAITALCLLPAHGALATINIPSNGDDGALNITSSTVIDLSDPNVVTTAAWDAATPGIAAYDSTKWAVVFHYTDVNIAAGATLSFVNHPKNPPVVWLVSGSVTINGTVDIKGHVGAAYTDEAEGGPGGFRGGRGPAFGIGRGGGFGPGASASGSGSFGTTGSYGGPTYGTPELLPLIGGSGGASSSGGGGSGGGGGGGAILIAASNDVTVNGTIDATGGPRGFNSYQPQGGSGGAIRILADSFSGSSTGTLRAIGGIGENAVGGLGRICINTNSMQSFLGTIDPAPATPTVGTSPQIWPDSTAPVARIVEIGGLNPGADPGASVLYPHQDVILSATGSVVVRIETLNVPQASTVVVHVARSRGANLTPVSATFQSGTTALAYWTATIPSSSLSNGAYALQARAVLP